MTEHARDDLWREFPKTAMEFEAKFATEADCRAYWIEARWGGEPACAACASRRLWSERDGFLFECADCGHQTSLTSGTLLEKNAQTLQDVVPGRLRNSVAQERHLGEGVAADHGFWIVQDSLGLAAQAARGAGAHRPRKARRIR